jgi:hypothetical protein
VVRARCKKLPYDPFEDVGRAERQEFGDVLAEGLYALLHFGSDISAVTGRFWNEFLAARKRFLEEIVRRADSVAPEVGQNIVRAVQTAMLRLMPLQPQELDDYINAWRDDLCVWAERLETAPRVSSLDEALEMLALGPAQLGRPLVQVRTIIVHDLQEILDVIAFAVRRRVSNLRYRRMASVFEQDTEMVRDSAAPRDLGRNSEPRWVKWTVGLHNLVIISDLQRHGWTGGL